MLHPTWLRGDPLPWLLDHDSPGVRYLALRDVVGLGEASAELRSARRAAHRDGPIAAVLAHMEPAGYWVKPGPGYNPKYRSSVWAIILLAELGARIEEDRRIAAGCAYVLDHALAPGGQFSALAAGAPSGTADCLQGNLCWALSELGSDDPRLERAFEWMARSVTGEGVAPASERAAPVRYFAGKCGPTFACGANNRLPCAWGGVKVMLAFGQLPRPRRTPLIKRAIRHGAEFLLEGDPASAAYPNGYAENPSGNWWKFGFPVFYVADVLQNVEALARLGYGHDHRLARALKIVIDKQDAQGRWALEYDYAGKTWFEVGPKRQPNKWVTLRALRALQATPLQ
jgi:hypothetical protein